MPPKRARRAAICCVTTPTRRSGRIPSQVVVVVVAFCFFVWLLGSAGTWGCAGRPDDALLRNVVGWVPRPEFSMPYI
jgi:hypothetical protein